MLQFKSYADQGKLGYVCGFTSIEMADEWIERFGGHRARRAMLNSMLMTSDNSPIVLNVERRNFEYQIPADPKYFS